MFMYLNDAITQYLNWKATHTNKAVVNYKLHLKRFKEFLNNKGVGEITLSDVVEFQELYKKRYASANVAYAITILKNFFQFLQANKIDSVNPLLIKTAKFIPKSHAAVSEEEFQKMDSLLKENDFWELQRKVIIRLLWETGMRVSELCDLNVSDIDVRQMKVMIRTKKNNKFRWIFWSLMTHYYLEKFLGIRIYLQKKDGLFIASDRGGSGERVTTRTIQRWISELAKEAGINKKITPHSFRHAKAHEVLNRGGSVKDVQVLLGHSEENPRAAFSYLRLNPTEIEKRAKLFLDNAEK